MDKISFKKIWQDDSIILTNIEAASKFIICRQECYFNDFDFDNMAKQIEDYLKDNKLCKLAKGEKQGNYTPSFSMTFYPLDKTGHAQIEMDMEIDDNLERKHRCSFYIYMTYGNIEKFAKELRNLAKKESTSEAFMCEENFEDKDLSF